MSRLPDSTAAFRIACLHRNKRVLGLPEIRKKNALEFAKKSVGPRWVTGH